jgi:hypothetical protein
MSLIYHEVVETHSCVLGTSEAISVYQIKSHILDRFWILQSYKGYFGAKQSQPNYAFWLNEISNIFFSETTCVMKLFQNMNFPYLTL